GSTVTIIDDGGTDEIDFSPAMSGINIDLSMDAGQVQAVDTSGNGMAISGTIENVTGSPFNDFINGNAADNSLNGGDGNDTINGGAGNNTLNGGLGNDSLTGGPGNNTLVGGGG